MKKLTIVTSATLLCLLASCGAANAEMPGAIGVLAREPVSLLDFGMYQVNEEIKQNNALYILERSMPEIKWTSASTQYEFDSEEISAEIWVVCDDDTSKERLREIAKSVFAANAPITGLSLARLFLHNGWSSGSTAKLDQDAIARAITMKLDVRCMLNGELANVKARWNYHEQKLLFED